MAGTGPSAQLGDDLDMRREEELVDRHDAGDAVAAIDQDAEIAGKRARIAGDRDQISAPETWQACGLRRGAGARRVEHHRVVALQAPSRRAGCGIGRGLKVSHRLQLRRPAGRLGERRKRRLVGLEGIDRGVSRQAQR